MLVSAAAITIGSACLGACGVPGDGEAGDKGLPSSPPLMRSLVPASEQLCGLNSVDIAPDGQTLIAWHRPPSSEQGGLGRGVILPLDCVNDAGNSCATSLRRLGGLEVLSWSRDATSLFVRGSDKIFQLEPGPQGGYGVRSSASITLDPAVRMRRLGPTSSESAAAEVGAFFQAYGKARRFASGSEDIKAIALSGEQSIWLTGDDHDRLHLSTSRGRDALPKALSAPVYRDVELAFLGEVPEAYIAGWSSSQSRSPYHHPLIDARSGQRLGTFGPEGVALSPRHDWLSAAVAEFLRAAPGYRLDDLSVSGDTAAAVSHNLNGDTTAGVFTRQGRSDRLTCKVSGSAAPPREWSQVALTAGSHSVALSLYRAAPQSDGLVVYFHGGPANSLREARYLATVRRYAALGFDVVAVDGAGSRDIGLAALSQLAVDAPAAIEADAQVVRGFVSGLRPGYGRVIVHGESFGASQAIVTAKTLGADALVLVAPWLVHRAPDDWMTGDAMASRKANQIRWERAVFGEFDSVPARRFRTWMVSLADGSRFNSRSLIVFAQQDPVSRPGDVGAGDARVHVLPGNHATLLANPQTWTLIGSHLNPDGQVR